MILDTRAFLSTGSDSVLTSEFQDAIDQICKSGGGELIVSPGLYTLGNIKLGSNITINLHPGATIILSENYNDFTSFTTVSQAERSNSALLYAYKEKNISITGGGKIFGNAFKYFDSEIDEYGYRQPQPYRPRIIVFEDCENLFLEKFTIQSAPMWTVHLVSCRNVVISKITIDNELTTPNSDCVDIDSCQIVRISDCYLSSTDDCICIKTTKKPLNMQQDVSQMTVTNCVMRTKGCAVKIGTETFGSVSDVAVSNCVVNESNRGVSISSRDGGAIRGITFNNIIMNCTMADECHWGRADPIFISSLNRHEEVTPGVVEFVSFNNIMATCEGAINFYSEPRGLIRHIQVCQVSLNQKATDSPMQGFYDIRPPCDPSRPTSMGMANAYVINPDTHMPFGVHKYAGGLPALYSKGVENLTVQDLKVLRPSPLPQGWNNKSEIVE
ncbi:right-handed parallel beta-helix repeat-containing protein [Dipodascopsis uninucleata]